MSKITHPGNLNRAKPYPANEEISVVRKVAGRETLKLFKTKIPQGLAPPRCFPCQVLIYGSKVNSWGQKVGGILKTSALDLKEVISSHAIGNKINPQITPAITAIITLWIKDPFFNLFLTIT